MSTRNISWGSRRPVRRAHNLTTFMCRLSRNLRASTSWNPQGLSRPVMGLLYLSPLHYICDKSFERDLFLWRNGPFLGLILQVLRHDSLGEEVNLWPTLQPGGWDLLIHDPRTQGDAHVDCVRNVMAHAQKTDFVFRRNARFHLDRRGRHFSRLLAAEVCASAVVMLDKPCSEVVWRVLATHSIRQFPLHFPSRASPCAVTITVNTWSFTRIIFFSSY